MARIVQGQRSTKAREGSFHKEAKKARKTVAEGLADSDLKHSKNASIEKLIKIIGELMTIVDSLEKRIAELDKRR